MRNIDRKVAGLAAFALCGWPLPALAQAAAPDQPPAAAPALPAPVYGPARPSSEPVEMDERPRLSFGQQVSTVKWELGGALAYMTIINVAKGSKEGWESFHFKDEGWFGKSTQNVGVDKFTHAFNTYLLADIFYTRLARRTGNARGAAVTAAVLGSGLMAYNELFDAHKGESGWGWQDMVANTAGAALSVARNTMPGLKEKLDFRLLLVPNKEVYTFSGRGHYEQQRYLLALKLSGFKGLERGPLRLVELHAGYYAAHFSDAERARGVIPDRRPFIGVGLNLKELFFREPRSGVARAARNVLDYVQVPYTAVHVW